MVATIPEYSGRRGYRTDRPPCDHDGIGSPADELMWNYLSIGQTTVELLAKKCGNSGKELNVTGSLNLLYGDEIEISPACGAACRKLSSRTRGNFNPTLPSSFIPRAVPRRRGGDFASEDHVGAWWSRSSSLLHHHWVDRGYFTFQEQVSATDGQLWYCSTVMRDVESRSGRR